MDYLTSIQPTIGITRYRSLVTSLLKMLLDPNLDPPFTITGNLSSFFTDSKEMAAFTSYLENQDLVDQVEGEEAITEAQSKTIAGTNIETVSTIINGVVVMGQPQFIDSVKKANEAMIKAGKGPIIITESLRTHEQQNRFYQKWLAYQAGTGPKANYAAKPGTSLHEIGLALDCNNSTVARPYLNDQGLKSNSQVSGKGERWHFSKSGY